MNVVVSSLFRIMKLPHEGRIIIIDQLAHCDPPSRPTHDRISSSVAHIESMNYVAT